MSWEAALSSLARDSRQGSPGLCLAGAGFAAALTILAFPPYGYWPLAFVALAPLVYVLVGARPHVAFLTTWFYSWTMAVAIVRWLALPLSADFGVAPVRAWVFTLGFVGCYAMVPASAVAAWAWLSRRRPVSGWIVAWQFAAIFALAEALRGGPLLLPWLLIGQAFSSAPLWIQAADMGGTTAVSFVALSASAGLALAAARRDVRVLVLPALTVMACAGYGTMRLAEPTDDGVGFEVGIVQAAVLPSERFLPDSAERNVARHLLWSRDLLEGESLDLLVWAETSIDAYVEASPDLVEAIQRFVDRTGVPLVSGAPRRRAPGVQTNAVVLFSPGAQTLESYDKQLLVPFAEYDPWISKSLAPLIGELARDEPFTHGTAPMVLRTGPLPLAAPVCFEISYPEAVRAFRTGGAQLLVNLSNDAWFGRVGFPEIHLGQAIFRAVEMRSWVVRGANTGISAVIDPAGRVTARRPAFDEGTLRGTVHAAGRPSFFARFGSTPFLALLGLGLFASIRPSR